MNTKDIPILLPFMGEFGSKLAKHVPGVYMAPRPIIVCHEVGEEPIYPNVTERWIYERPVEDERKAGGHIKQEEYYKRVKEHFGKDRKYISSVAPFKWPWQHFIPEHVGGYEAEFDVLLFPRKKEYAHDRNWQYWDMFYDALVGEGIKCLIGGQPDSTHVPRGCLAVWDLIDDPSQVLDANIWAIKNATFRVGTATGTTFLSLLCAKPVVVIIGDNGMDSLGSKNGFNSGSYFKIDHKRAGWRVISHWGEPEIAIQEFLRIYADPVTFDFQCHEWVVGIHRRYERLSADRQLEIRTYVMQAAQKGPVDVEKLAVKIGYSVESTMRICTELEDQGKIEIAG